MSVTSAKGTKGNPYTKAEYDKMVTNSSWSGGWVRKDEVTVYITARGKVEQDDGGRTLGSEGNPFTDQAYYEMDLREEWVGGYVQFAGESKPSYVRPSGENEVDGSGCGSGSGCGCGCGSTCGSGCGSGSGRLTPGSEIIAVPGGGRLKVSWDVESKVSVTDMSTGEDVRFEKNGYDIMIQYRGFHIRYTIPEFYRVDCDGYDNKQ